MPTKKERIAVFGGTFDPLHIGHMALANIVYYRSPLPLKAVCLVPTVQNPLKLGASLLSFDFRCEMIEGAIHGDRRFFFSRIEEQLPSPHYTIDLLEALSLRHPQFSFVLLIGSDNWLSFSKWYRYEDLLANYEIIIYPRKGFPLDSDKLPKTVYYLNDFPIIEVSSTEIRKGVKNGEDLRFLLPTPELFPFLKREIAIHNE